MMFQDLGASYTEIPGVEWARVEPSEAFPRRVRIVLKFHYFDEPTDFGIDEFEEFVDTMSVIHKRAETMASSNDARERIFEMRRNDGGQ